jgi:hypothetical protein
VQLALLARLVHRDYKEMLAHLDLLAQPDRKAYKAIQALQDQLVLLAPLDLKVCREILVQLDRLDPQALRDQLAHKAI